MPERKDVYHVPNRVKFYRWVLRGIFRLIFHILGSVNISGLENIPKKGPYIIAINHISIVDPPFIVAFWPQAPEAVRANELWERRGQSIIVRLYGCIRVHRGVYDRNSLETMIEVIRAGCPLLIAPEGGRSHNPGMKRAYPGIAYLADKTQAPILPVGINGSTDEYLKQAVKFKRPSLSMLIGEPLLLPSVEGTGEQRRAGLMRNTHKLMYELAVLLPSDYQGVYAIPNNSFSETA